MARFAHRHSDGLEQFNAALEPMKSSPDLVELGQDERGEDRFTTRDMIEAEQRLHRAAEPMAEHERHAVSESDRLDALAHAEERGLVLSGEQADAFARVTDGRDLGIVVGYAGTGKSAMLDAAFRSIHERHGGVEIHEVRRQREDWQRDATRDLASGRTGNAIAAYGP